MLLGRFRAFFASAYSSPPPPAEPPPGLDFRFERLQPEVPRPVPMSATPGGDGAVLVGTGAFRIDLRRALEKLSRFQLASAEEFLLPWLRCAVAGGARRVSVDFANSALELSFDGEALPPGLVEAPFSALVEEGLNRRGRHLAYGLLGALRLGPAWASIESGRGKGRVRLATGEAPPGEPGRGDTRIQLGWPAAAEPGVRRALEALRRGAGFHGCRLTVDGREVPEVPAEGFPFKEAGSSKRTRAVLQVAPGEATSRLSLYVSGARAADVARDLGVPGPVRMFLRHDDLSLDLSQSKVLEDAEFERMAARAAADARQLADRLAQGWSNEVEADWVREVVMQAIPTPFERPPRETSDGFTALLWRAEVFKSRRGDKLSLGRIAELVKVWGPEVVVGSDAAIPAFNVRPGGPRERAYLERFFGAGGSV